MRIVLAGGGSGGHFYPLIAVAQELLDIVDEKKMTEPEIFYLSVSPYDTGLLYQNNISFRRIYAGKMRKYASLQNGVDFIKTLIGVPHSLFLLFSLYPDIVFTKGGYPSVPVVFAARILGIPVFVHDSDVVPGRANLFAARFAERIAVSYPEAIPFFEEKAKKEKIAYTGNPIRKEVRSPLSEDAHTYFNLDRNVPTVLILGGSQGAEHINNTVFGALEEFLKTHQVIHQIGKDNFKSFQELTSVILHNSSFSSRYHPFPSLSSFEMVAAAGASDIIVSRAGSGSIFEIAQWEKPALLVPIPEHISRDQKKNAYAYARAGGCEVIEQQNFTPHILLSEVKRILSDASAQSRMIKGARAFKKPDAARNIAEEIVRIGLLHEKGKE